MDILEILKKAAENQAADIFIVCGAVLSFKAHGKMYELNDVILSTDDTRNLVLQIFRLAKRDITEDQLPERENRRTPSGHQSRSCAHGRDERGCGAVKAP